MANKEYEVLRNLNIGKAIFDCGYEKDGTIHLLDLDKPGTRSVTNAIDKQFQSRVLEEIGLEHMEYEKDVKWILYGTDGVASSFVDGDFKFIPENDERLIPEFVEEMRKI